MGGARLTLGVGRALVVNDDETSLPYRVPAHLRRSSDMTWVTSVVSSSGVKERKQGLDTAPT
jgi:hypothetical protein